MNNLANASLTGCDDTDAALLLASLATVTSLVPVLLYQAGAIRHLPDPPSRIFASEKITSSKMAHPAGVPDSIPGLVSFSTTLALLFLSKNNLIARRLLGAKLLLDAGAAAFNASRQLAGFGKLCSWCTGTAVAAGVTVYAGRRLIFDSLSGNWSEDPVPTNSTHVSEDSWTRALKSTTRPDQQK